MERKAKAAKKCCTDRHQQLRSDKSTSITYNQLTLGTSAVILPSEPIFRELSYQYVPLTAQYPVSLAPPSGSGVPVFLRNCIFRI